MMRLGFRLLLSAVTLALTFVPARRGAAQTQAPEFKEVYDLLRAHLPEMTEAELERTALQSLLNALGPRAVLLTNDTPATSQTDAPLVSRATVFEGPVAYLRIGRVGDDLAKAVKLACQMMSATNKLDGLVLDLRYAGGDDYAAAARTVDLFLKKERPLLDWGQGTVKSTAKDDALSLPVTALVNHETVGAAEALAAALRETGAGLVLGNRTAGLAMIAQEFPLKTGGRLRVATAPIKLGDGSALSPQGLKPDITVDIASEDERTYYNDAYKELPRVALAANTPLSLTNAPNGTNRTRRGRFNEADLVRERREGLSPDSILSADEPERPMVHDPVLARAIDFLKGLAVVRRRS